MAGVYMRTEDYEKALECGKRAVRLAPEESPSWNALRAAAMQLFDGVTYYRAVIANIKSISDGDLAQSVSDLREMGFEQQAEELLEYTVRINRKSVSVDALPFAESRAPKLMTEAVNQQMYKIINKKSAAAKERAASGGKAGRYDGSGR
jgi:tetratricopeptide (TPR) repeat protein